MSKSLNPKQIKALVEAAKNLPEALSYNYLSVTCNYCDLNVHYNWERGQGELAKHAPDCPWKLLKETLCQTSP